jgi:hypothetical protein
MLLKKEHFTTVNWQLSSKLISVSGIQQGVQVRCCGFQ